MKVTEILEPLFEDSQLTQNDLDEVERFADKIFAKVGIDVEFSRHFIKRVNDARNQKQITTAELVRIFKKTYQRYGKKIPKLGDNAQAVLQDTGTHINVPFVLHWNDKTQEFQLMSKTIMRKTNFSSTSQKLPV